MIKEVETIEEANKCDELLTKLILDEKNYDKNIDDNILIKDYFSNIYHKNNNILLTYIIDNNIVGYIYAKKIEKSLYLIDGLYVEKKYRNKGIAKELINKIIEICKIMNIKYVDINSMYKNDLALNLYKKLNFEQFRVTLRHKIEKS